MVNFPEKISASLSRFCRISTSGSILLPPIEKFNPRLARDGEADEAEPVDEPSPRLAGVLTKIIRLEVFI